jgi:hypothetical protein
VVQVEGQVVMLTLLSVILPFIPDAVLLRELRRAHFHIEREITKPSRWNGLPLRDIASLAMTG